MRCRSVNNVPHPISYHSPAHPVLSDRQHLSSVSRTRLLVNSCPSCITPCSIYILARLYHERQHVLGYEHTLLRQSGLHR